MSQNNSVSFPARESINQPQGEIGLSMFGSIKSDLSSHLPENLPRSFNSPFDQPSPPQNDFFSQNQVELKQEQNRSFQSEGPSEISST